MEYKNAGENFAIQTGILTSGIYFLQIRSREGLQYMKFIKS
jgi:hypothetical protein